MATVLAFILASAQLPESDDTPRLWPAPQHVSALGSSATSLRLDPAKFTISSNLGSSRLGANASHPLADILAWNVDYYQGLLFARQVGRNVTSSGGGDDDDDSTSVLPLTSLSIVIGSSSSSSSSSSGGSNYPTLGMDESYTLSVGSPGATLAAPSVWGAVRGLETFSQLLAMNGAHFEIRASGTNITIADAPRFPWRGLMLDPARHFLSVAQLTKQIDAMAQNKLNVLHLHLTDGESFTLGTDTWPTYPSLSAKGAYHPSLAYTPADVAAVVGHGRLRGVRVVPEFDMPAHMASWAQAVPELLTDCPGVNPHPEWPTYYSPADVTNPTLLAVLGELLEQAGPLFPDPFWHVGGDEPHYACWEANANISSYMKAAGLSSEGLYARFEASYAALLASHGKSVVGWQEVAANTGGGPGPATASTVVQVWEGNAALASFVARGYRAIVSSNWYLNNGGDWTKYYNDDPLSYLPANASAAERARVLGGEAAMWNSAFDAASNMEPAIWPNAAAMAEMLWSPRVESNDDARTRLSQQRCRMVRRGVRASPIAEDHCDDALYVRKSRTFYFKPADFPRWPNTPAP